jgi:hypothetical protein
MKYQSDHRSGPYRSVSVEVSTHILDLEFQLVLGSLVGTLEGKVLKEVCGSVGLVSLCSAAGVDPDANSGCLSPWGVFSRNRESVGESRRLGGGRQGDRRSKATLHGLNGLQGSTAPQSLVEVER